MERPPPSPTRASQVRHAVGGEVEVGVGRPRPRLGQQPGRGDRRGHGGDQHGRHDRGRNEPRPRPPRPTTSSAIATRPIAARMAIGCDARSHIRCGRRASSSGHSGEYRTPSVERDRGPGNERDRARAIPAPRPGRRAAGPRARRDAGGTGGRRRRRRSPAAAPARTVVGTATARTGPARASRDESRATPPFRAIAPT